jgi:hypothetical protein
MEPLKALIREARDSATHPNSVPMILAMDFTGSMLDIPKNLIREGLPKLMGGLIQRGIPDPQLLFLGIGDTQCDSYPLQVGQFECGDEELDTWLTRSYLEGGGGGNGGESYHLAWYYAAKHTVTDAWEKRKQKGFLFTIGDEPCLPSLPANVVRELMGDNPERTLTNNEMLEMASEKYNVYHLHVMEGSQGSRSLSFWKELMGDRCIKINHHEDIPKQIIEIVTANTDMSQMNNVIITDTTPLVNGYDHSKDDNIIL